MKTVTITKTVEVEEGIPEVIDELSENKDCIALYDMFLMLRNDGEEDFKKTMYCWIVESRDEFTDNFNFAFEESEEFQDEILNGIVKYINDNADEIDKNYDEWYKSLDEYH